MSTAATAFATPAPVPPRHLLPTLVLAQLGGTSPWFAVNAVMPELQRAHGYTEAAVGTLSSALQLGFIAGTLLFALLALADRFSARRLFLLSTCSAALCTVAAAVMAHSYTGLLLWRVATGFCLAGIYPVGMKIASQWFPRGLGTALGWLLGALVLGSASPYLLRAVGAALPWQSVFVAVATLAVLAGVAVVRLIPEPPARPGAVPLRLGALASLWRDARTRASVFGYFGHMWELYTVWVLMPLVLATRLQGAVAVSGWAFVALGAGALGCVVGGLLAPRFGSARVAGTQLATSGLCCLAAPWMLQAPLPLFLAWLVLWGITVSGDSPQFSALTATNAPREAVGSVLTLTNSIGFAISALSIELFVRLSATQPLATLLPWLALGPVLGLLALRPLWAAPPPR
ncbi:MFS transporter [Rubrivivax rivuli]|uniref:MFS transporter n=1 Tax=Rubrivivax rivuli TaxID=1862385 RepID=A0A437R908_9BURK|nr:MFS transporter [Rubrivivax rivuli]RVU43260.1 MFS transporter [Rubrivivax rivuli]